MLRTDNRRSLALAYFAVNWDRLHPFVDRHAIKRTAHANKLAQFILAHHCFLAPDRERIARFKLSNPQERLRSLVSFARFHRILCSKRNLRHHHIIRIAALEQLGYPRVQVVLHLLAVDLGFQNGYIPVRADSHHEVFAHAVLLIGGQRTAQTPIAANLL